MNKLILPALAVLAALFFSGGNAVAAEEKPAYNYITAAELQSRIKAGTSMTLLDIQVEEEFDRHHIKGALPTYAYPVKTEEDKARLSAVLEKSRANTNPVVIVCPRGAGGATRTYDYLLAKGVEAGRLLILEKGQEGWQFPELTEGK